jgi:hypothetical protein
MKRCILHVGHPKTASTYLQTALALNAEPLRTAGFWVPADFTGFGSYDCRQLAEDGHTFSGNLQPLFEAAEAHDDALIEQITHYLFSKTAEHLILSSELLFYYRHIVVALIRRAAEAGFRVTLVAYIARQDRAAVADYVQNIRNHGTSGSILEFLTRQQSKFPHLHYADVFARYATEPCRVVARTFDHRFLLAGDILTDFAAIAGLPQPWSDLIRPARTVNAGLPLEYCEVMRGLHAAKRDASAIGNASCGLSPIERERIMQHYFRPELRDHLLTEYMPGNRSLIDTHLSDRSVDEQDHWRSLGPAGNGVALDAARMAECLGLLLGNNLTST